MTATEPRKDADRLWFAARHTPAPTAATAISVAVRTTKRSAYIHPIYRPGAQVGQSGTPKPRG